MFLIQRSLANPSLDKNGPFIASEITDDTFEDYDISPENAGKTSALSEKLV